MKASLFLRTAACSLILGGALSLNPAVAPTGHAGPLLVHVAETETPQPGGDVLDVAAAQGEFQTFLRAVEVAGYEDTLRGEGPFTIFAPTDAAFEEMGAAEVDRLMQPQAHEELLALLAYHVVAERVTSESVQGIVRQEAASGYRLTLDGRDGLRVNDQLVVTPDLQASNGMIQGINRVLSPPVMVASR